MKAFYKLFLVLFFLITSSIKTQAVTWYSVASGNAETGAVWSLVNVGPGSTAAALGGWSQATDIIIQGGNTIDLFSTGNVDVHDIVVQLGGVLYSTNATNRYFNVYGNITCNGIIGNGAVFNGIAFNIEGATCTISGTGTFDASRIRKSYNNNVVTNLTIAMNVNLRFDTSSACQLYNNMAGVYSQFNVTVNAGVVLNLTGNAVSKGNVSIDGIDGTGNGERCGTYTINGTMIVTGIIYAFTNNITAGDSCNWIIGPSGLVVASQVNSSASGVGKHNFTIQPGGKLDVNGPNAFSPFTTTNNVYRCQPTSVIEYSYGGNQTVEAGITYATLNISNTGTKTSNGSLTLNNNLNILGSAILSPNTNFIFIKGDWSNWGQAGFSESTGSVRFNGTTANQYINCPGGEVFNNLQIINSFGSGVNLNTDLTISNDLNLFTLGKLTFGNVARTVTLTKNTNTTSLLGTTNSRIDMNGAAHVLNIAAWASSFSGYLDGGLGTVVYNGTNNGSGFNQKIITGINIIYNNVTLLGTGIKYTDNDIFIGNNFLASGATVSYAALTNPSKTLILGGNFSLTSGATTDVACLDNISIVTTGNGNQTFTGNGNTIKAFNFNSVKTSGSLSLTGPVNNTTLIFKNNFLLDYSGGSGFSDNGNLIQAGNDVGIGGTLSAAANYVFSGTLEFTGINADVDLVLGDYSLTNASKGFINNLKINTGANSSPQNIVQLLPVSGGQPTHVLKNIDIITNSVLASNSNVLYVGGNWTNWGTNGFTEMGSTVNFNGIVAQTLTSIGTEDFENLTMSNTSAGLNLNNPIFINTTLNFTSGKINNNLASLVNMSSSSSAINASNNSFVNGPVLKSGSTDFLFPVGKNNNYRPIGLFGLTGASDFVVEYFNLDPQSVPYNVLLKDPSIDHISRCEYWTLNRQTGSANAKVILSWSAATSCGVTLLPDLRVAKWDGSMWKDEGNGGFAGNTAAGTLISTNIINQFQVFTLSSSSFGNNPLPVEMISFKAQQQTSSVALTWETATEINNNYFDVERSSNGINFETIGNVDGNGNTSSISKYNFNDSNPYSGINYYRLKQIDFDGNFKYTQIESVTFNKALVSGWELYPNPSSDIVRFNINSESNSGISLIVYNCNGSIVFENSLLIPETGTFCEIKCSSWDPGAYLFVFLNTGNGSRVVKQFIKR